MPNYSRIIHFESTTREELFNYCIDIAKANSFKVLEGNKLVGKVKLQVPLNWVSGGEVISIDLASFGPRTRVEVRSWSKIVLQIIDWGKNRRNVNQIIDEIEKKWGKHRCIY
jgi:hypothetical protein